MNQPIFIGNTVAIIDVDENPNEWATFTVVAQREDRFLLSTLDNKPTYEPLWVNARQIVPVAETPIIANCT